MVIDKNRQQFLLMNLDAIISNHWLLSRECLVTFYQRKKKDKQQQQLTVVLAEYCPQKMVLGSVIPSLGQRSVIIWKDNRENVSTQLLAGDVSLKISQWENWAFEVKKKKKGGVGIYSREREECWGQSLSSTSECSSSGVENEAIITWSTREENTNLIVLPFIYIALHFIGKLFIATKWALKLWHGWSPVPAVTVSKKRGEFGLLPVMKHLSLLHLP